PTRVLFRARTGPGRPLICASRCVQGDAMRASSSPSLSTGELHALIPSNNNFFLWAGPNQEVVNFYGEGDILQSVPLYFSEFLDKREQDVVFTFSEVTRRNRKSEVTTTYESNLKVDRRTYERHDFYNALMRPHGIDLTLELKVFEHGRGLGMLKVPRQI